MSGAFPLRATAIAGGRRWSFAAPGLDAQASAFALSSVVAILLALFAAFSLDLSRPIWALLTAFIVGQPHSGSVRSRSIYRFLGTLVGAAFAVFVTPALSTSPELLSLALAVWLGVCLFLSLLDRGPRSYVPMLAGYTASIIALSDVQAPGLIFDTALARVEEISVGILCASLAHAIFWPREVSAALERRIAGTLADADLWLADVLAGRSEASAERRRLAADITELELLSRHLRYDTARLRPSRRRVRALLDELSALAPLAAALEDRLQLLRREGALDPRLEQLAAEAETWLRAGRAEPQAAAGLQVRALALETELQAGWPDWRGLVHASAAGRLVEVMATVQALRERAGRLRGGGSPRPPHPALPREGGDPGFLSPHARASWSLMFALSADKAKNTWIPAFAGKNGVRGELGELGRRRAQRAVSPRPRRPLHRDVGLAALSGAVSAVALLAACAVWILGAWPEGGAAATFAGVGCCLFATQDDPTPSVWAFGVWLIGGIGLAWVYAFLVLPRVDGFLLMAAVLAPAILVIGYLQGQPAHNLRGLGLALGFGSGVGLQSRYHADLAGFLNGNLAVVVGLVFAFAILRLVRVIDAGWSGRRIVRRARRQIAALARARAPADRGAWLSRGLDRLGLINARLPEAGGAAEALTDLRVGLDVIDLQQLRREAPPPLRQALDEVLVGVARRFADRKPAQPEMLAPAIDRALWACAAEVEGEPRRLGLAALVDLRRSLGVQDPQPSGGAA